MEKYAIYSYSLKEIPIRNGDQLPFDSSQPVNLSPEQKFELLFGKKTGALFPVQKVKKRGEADKYDCVVLRNDENLILLRLVNEKQKDFWEEQPGQNPIPVIEKTTKQSKPFSYIIIDTRPDVHLVLIQSRSDAWKNPNDIKDLLQESINWRLDVEDCGLEVVLSTKMLPTKFWDYVDRKRKKDGVPIKSMTFSFTNYLRRPDIDIKSTLSSDWRRLESFMKWMDSLGGGSGEIKINAPKNEALVTRKMADIKHMVEICMNSNYALSVTFTDGVTYKCNQEVRAEMPMKDENIRKEFEDGLRRFFLPYRLTEWIDDIIKETKKYQDVEEIKPKPGRKAERKVS